MKQSNRTRVKAFTALILGMFLSLGGAKASDMPVIVENQNVCMVTNMHFAKKQIPVTHKGKTYYGCCDMCKATLSKDAKARTGVDPVSGKSVDKAKAVIAAQAGNSVLYFESKSNFEEYVKTITSFKPQKSGSGAHSHH